MSLLRFQLQFWLSVHGVRWKQKVSSTAETLSTLFFLARAPVPFIAAGMRKKNQQVKLHHPLPGKEDDSIRMQFVLNEVFKNIYTFNMSMFLNLSLPSQIGLYLIWQCSSNRTNWNTFIHFHVSQPTETCKQLTFGYFILLGALISSKVASCLFLFWQGSCATNCSVTCKNSTGVAFSTYAILFPRGSWKSHNM